MLAHGVPANSGPGRLAAVQQSSGTGRPGSAPSMPERRAMVPPSTPRLLPLLAGAGGDERLVARAVAVLVVEAVRGDRRVDETRVDRVQRVVVDAEARR